MQKIESEYTATIQGNTPSKSNCYKIVTKRGVGGKQHASLAKTDALKKYEEVFLWQVGKLRELMIDKPFKIYIDVYYPSKRSDLDNSFKIILDCLQTCRAIKNDNLVCSIIGNKYIDKDKPRVELRLTII